MAEPEPTVEPDTRYRHFSIPPPPTSPIGIANRFLNPTRQSGSWPALIQAEQVVPIFENPLCTRSEIHLRLTNRIARSNGRRLEALQDSASG